MDGNPEAGLCDAAVRMTASRPTTWPERLMIGCTVLGTVALMSLLGITVWSLVGAKRQETPSVPTSSVDDAQLRAALARAETAEGSLVQAERNLENLEFVVQWSYLNADGKLDQIIRAINNAPKGLDRAAFNTSFEKAFDERLPLKAPEEIKSYLVKNPIKIPELPKYLQAVGDDVPQFVKNLQELIAGKEGVKSEITTLSGSYSEASRRLASMEGLLSWYATDEQVLIVIVDGLTIRASAYAPLMQSVWKSNGYSPTVVGYRWGLTLLGTGPPRDLVVTTGNLPELLDIGSYTQGDSLYQAKYLHEFKPRNVQLPQSQVQQRAPRQRCVLLVPGEQPPPADRGFWSGISLDVLIVTPAAVPDQNFWTNYRNWEQFCRHPDIRGVVSILTVDMPNPVDPRGGIRSIDPASQDALGDWLFRALRPHCVPRVPMIVPNTASVKPR